MDKIIVNIAMKKKYEYKIPFLAIAIAFKIARILLRFFSLAFLAFLCCLHLARNCPQVKLNILFIKINSH